MRLLKLPKFLICHISRGTVVKSLHNLFWDTLFLAIANSYTEADRSKRSAEDEESETFYSFQDHLINAIQF